MGEEIYKTPMAEPLPEPPIDPKRGRMMAIVGLVFLGLPVVAFIVSLIFMSMAFGVLAKTGEADPAALADSISGALIGSSLGMVGGIIGGVICGLALFGRGNRERWFRVWVLVISVLALVVVPVGTIVGVVMIVGVIMKWREFGGDGRREMEDLKTEN